MLRVHGRNQAARQFFNPTDPAADLVIAVAGITEVSFEPASFTRNGVLTIRTGDGQIHRVYALRQHNVNFRRVTRLLAAACPQTPVTGSSGSTTAAVTAATTAATVAAERDPIELLAQLARLRDKGVITSAEFEAKKSQLLRRI